MGKTLRILGGILSLLCLRVWARLPYDEYQFFTVETEGSDKRR